MLINLLELKGCIKTELYLHVIKILLTGPQFSPARSAATSPPTFDAAVTAFRVIGVSVSPLCSATTSVDAFRAWRSARRQHPCEEQMSF